MKVTFKKRPQGAKLRAWPTFEQLLVALYTLKTPAQLYKWHIIHKD